MCCSLLEDTDRIGSPLPKQTTQIYSQLRSINTLHIQIYVKQELLPFTPTFFENKHQWSVSLPVLQVCPPQSGRQAQRNVSPWS